MEFDNVWFDVVNDDIKLDKTIADIRVIATIPALPGIFNIYKAGNLIGYEHPNADNPDWTTFEEDERKKTINILKKDNPNREK